MSKIETAAKSNAQAGHQQNQHKRKKVTNSRNKGVVRKAAVAPSQAQGEVPFDLMDARGKIEALLKGIHAVETARPDPALGGLAPPSSSHEHEFQLPATVCELSEMARPDLERACVQLDITDFHAKPDRDLIALIALRGPYGKDGKMYAVRKVRELVQSVDCLLREIGLVRPDGPAVVDILDARFKNLKRAKDARPKKRMRTDARNTSDETAASDATESDADGARLPGASHGGSDSPTPQAMDAQSRSSSTSKSTCSAASASSIPPFLGAPATLHHHLKEAEPKLRVDTTALNLQQLQQLQQVARQSAQAPVGNFGNHMPLPSFLQNALPVQVVNSPLVFPWLQNMQHQVQPGSQPSAS
ncbi:Hypothetical Protein FCC1311_016702 [Hondaea fermentalgiana]|uniref:Uncharacterized protein n=1 Tax=Hondaea fermentalgiana TaxID=2315210 RepID=A0A2R5G368_9STRA|nr:Hypothetical Protein FCC1311_016702 [Hondaea fermentalgiana]|eukprot:GBG25452.1 Hypothetical Protein FCC1311_016702 [Hondaea fermentalgiana]